MIIAKKVAASIIAQRQIASSYFRLRLASAHIAHSAQPGQFIHLLARSSRICDPLLRRAFSIMSVQDDTFEILYKVLGKGTEQMSLWRTGQTVDIIGPLGQPFQFSSEEALPETISFLVGGGVGVPPLGPRGGPPPPGGQMGGGGGRN
jgi:dihydroorotate dehydrogenase electron transfer subunit